MTPNIIIVIYNRSHIKYDEMKKYSTTITIENIDVDTHMCFEIPCEKNLSLTIKLKMIPIEILCKI